jgi:hypothetical protein
MPYQVAVAYDKDLHKAALDCPLCQKHWEFPFPAQQILGKLAPTPAQMVILHLYGTGPNFQYCLGFDPFTYTPIVEFSDEARTTLNLELVRNKR